MTGVASAAPQVSGGVSRGTALTHQPRSHGNNPVATYEWFYNPDGGGWVDAGHLTISSGNTWSAVDFSDGGTWIQSGKTISLECNTGGDATDGLIELGTIGKHGISSEAKPGTWVAPEGGVPGTFYLVKL
jgi:hypothetical protein